MEIWCRRTGAIPTVKAFDASLGLSRRIQDGREHHRGDSGDPLVGIKGKALSCFLIAA
jgi:hypothetical protein